jgi:hypothetical protein
MHHASLRIIAPPKVLCIMPRYESLPHLWSLPLHDTVEHLKHTAEIRFLIRLGPPVHGVENQTERIDVTRSAVPIGSGEKVWGK